MKPGRVSVVIPALNEAAHLPRLLEALNHQTLLPAEIILADAGSNDGTVALAQAAGVQVVPGGRPAAGRNAGARAATRDLILFLDADVLPRPDFLSLLLAEFDAEGLGVATCLMEPLSEQVMDWLICDTTNLYLQLIQQISPHAPGFCILVQRSIHEAVGGFDESVVMAEDHDYVQRASRVGKFGVLTGARIPVSVRRIEKEGLVRLAMKYLYCELHALAGQPIRTLPFAYEFGSYEKAPSRWFVDIAWLRHKLGRFENPLARLTRRGRAALKAMGSMQLDADAFERRLRALLPAELAVLREYLHMRRTVLLMQNARLQAGFKRWQQRPLEGIRLLELEWNKFWQAPEDDSPNHSDGPLTPPEDMDL